MQQGACVSASSPSFPHAQLYDSLIPSLFITSRLLAFETVVLYNRFSVLENHVWLLTEIYLVDLIDWLHHLKTLEFFLAKAFQICSSEEDVKWCVGRVLGWQRSNWAGKMGTAALFPPFLPLHSDIFQSILSGQHFS